MNPTTNYQSVDQIRTAMRDKIAQAVASAKEALGDQLDPADVWTACADMLQISATRDAPSAEVAFDRLAGFGAEAVLQLACPAEPELPSLSPEERAARTQEGLLHKLERMHNQRGASSIVVDATINAWRENHDGTGNEDTIEWGAVQATLTQLTYGDSPDLETAFASIVAVAAEAILRLAKAEG